MSRSGGWLAGKIRTLGWFLLRPKFYNQAFRILRYRIVPHAGESTRAQATRWCEDRAVSTRTALRLLLGPGERRPMAEIERGRFEEALKSAQAVPVPMGGPGDLDLLYHLAQHERVENVIETGVAFGWSSLAILLGIGSSGRLFSIDMPYVKGDNEQYVGSVVPADIRSRWTLIRLPDRRALPKALKALGAIQLCHYDSDKTYVGRMWGYRLLWDALESDTFFVSDDISDNDAFRVFSESVGQEPIVIRPGRPGEGTKYVGVLVKS